mmetsp:Transcript_67502/g.173857  ORF Transcript_67502/g.173857 Transcript_67502/m.173857 type:complete len:204 (-) Transcript_67502:2592-3203(-)
MTSLLDRELTPASMPAREPERRRGCAPCRWIRRCISPISVWSCRCRLTSLEFNCAIELRVSRTPVVMAYTSTRERFSLVLSTPLARAFTLTRPVRSMSTVSYTRFTSPGASFARSSVCRSSSKNSSLMPAFHSCAYSSGSSAVDTLAAPQSSRTLLLGRSWKSSAPSRISCGILCVPILRMKRLSRSTIPRANSRNSSRAVSD